MWLIHAHVLLSENTRKNSNVKVILPDGRYYGLKNGARKTVYML